MRKLTSKNAGTMHGKILRATSLIVSGAFALFCICFIWFNRSNVMNTSTNNAVNHFNQTASFLRSQTQALRSSLDTLTLHDEYALLLNDQSVMSDPESTAYDLIQSMEHLPSRSDLSKVMLISDSPVITESFQLAYQGREYVLPLSDYRDTPWYQIISASADACIWMAADQLFPHISGEEYFIFTRKLPYEYPTHEVYYIGFIKTSFLEELLFGRMPDSYSSSIIINSENQYLLGSIQMDGMIADDLVSAARRNYDTSLQPVTAEQITIGGQLVLLSTQRIRNTNLHLITCYAIGQAWTDHVHQSVLLMFTILIPILLLVVIVATVYAKTITTPLRLLTAEMLKVSGGDFDIEPLPMATDHDLRRMTQCFEYLVGRLKELMQQQYELGQQMKDTELKALQAQINPHFLYNTLDLIRWKAVKYKDKEIQNLVIALSRYYRISLSKGADYVPLQTEINHITEYTYIQNQRFDDGITLSVHVAEGCENCMLPKLTLQPIVENCIYHGILETEEARGHISVEAGMEGENILIRVTDDGCGMDEETISHLLDGSVAGADSRGSGYGLGNVDRRLKLIYGPDCGLSFDSKIGIGTCVTIRIPVTNDTSKKEG